MAGYNHSIHVSVSNVSNSGFTVNGSITLGSNSYNANGFTCYVYYNGNTAHQNTTVKISSRGGSASWSHTYDVGTSTSARTFTCYAGADLSWSGQKADTGNPVSTTVTVPATAPSVTIPPNVSNVAKSFNASTNVATVTWTNNGSGASTPKSNYVDVQIDDSSWTNIYNGALQTSYSYTCSDNHKYKFRVNSYNSAGQSTHQETGIIYTKPAAASFNASSYKSGSAYILQLNIDNSNVNWPYLSSGDANNTIICQANNLIWTGNTGDVGLSVSSTSSYNSELYTLLSNLYNGNYSKLIITCRQYNADYSLYTDSTYELTKVSLQPKIWIRIPDGATIKNIWLNCPAGYKPK